MFSNPFGIEIEFTGINRARAAGIVARYLGGDVINTHDSYDARVVEAPDGRLWRIVYDSSIACQQKVRSRYITANRQYSVELVSPVLKYREDIDTLQALVRRLRAGGGFTNATCGIHIHLDGSNHTPTSIRNFVNIIASRNDLFYKALQIAPERMNYCKKMDAYLVTRLNALKPVTFEGISRIWYEGYRGSPSSHYHDSRYHFLNLHSFFHGNHTIELRGFNGCLHAGKVRAYVVFALALNNQALTQKRASYQEVHTENEKFAMRVYLNRIGFIGDEFKSCREHLYQHLDGNAAWRYGSRENVSYHVNRNRNGGDANEEE